MSELMQLPLGFRFHPTDEELVVHYLCGKCNSEPIDVPFITELDLYRYDPWDLPARANYGEKEWYFFSPRDRKYPNGLRPNRLAGSGYWKATGQDKGIGHPRVLGIKKSLVFYVGKKHKGKKTNWIMHEYRLADVDHSIRRINSLRLDDWVLCRIYFKECKVQSQQVEQPQQVQQPQQVEQSHQDFSRQYEVPELEVKKQDNSVVGVAGPSSSLPIPEMGLAPMVNDYVWINPSDSLPELNTGSSCSEDLVSLEFASKVLNEPNWNEMEQALDIPYAYMDANPNSMFDDQFQSATQVPPFQDMFASMEKPFEWTDEGCSQH